jgi:large subunit ribosomal protein L20
MVTLKHKKIFKAAKGFLGRGKNVHSVAANRVYKARLYAYRSRRLKKRDFRTATILSVGAASRQHGVPYSKVIHGLTMANVQLDRSALSKLAVTEPQSFKSVMELIKQVHPFPFIGQRVLNKSDLALIEAKRAASAGAVRVPAPLKPKASMTQ